MNAHPHTLVSRQLTEVIGVTHLSPNAFVLRMQRKDLSFRAGQYITLGFPGKPTRREYSIYSGEQDEHLEILALGVPLGSFSQQLQQLKPGTLLEVEGPFGYFLLPEEITGKKFIFIASGTGISPFHSFVRSHPGLDYTLLHGIRQIGDAYHREHYSPQRYIACTTRDQEGHFHGRVTEHLMKHPPDRQAEYYFCGNSQMIHDAMDVLSVKGVDPEKFHAEVYF